MADIPAKSVVDIVARTLNFVDPRLMNHGGRVAEFVNRVLVCKNAHTREQRRDICFMALLHDIGAYRTEEIDRIVHFETVGIWQHSVYGYLFIKHFSPLARFAPAIFFHHASCNELRHVHESFHALSQVLHIADRMDIMSQARGSLDRDVFHRHFDRGRNEKYRADLLDLFDAALFGGASEPEPFATLFGDASFTREESREYLRMMALSIDFRSPQTATHTMGVAGIAGELAGAMGLSGESADNIRLGALMHDLGKMGIPSEILESPERLNDEDMRVMRTHVALTEEILAGSVEPEILEIAISHHEKLRGDGYHRRLSADQLGVGQRLVAVADILSALLGKRSYKEAFPKERVLEILGSMARDHAIDADIVEVAAANFDRLSTLMNDIFADVVGAYEMLNREYQHLLARTENFGRGGLVIDEILSETP